MPKKPTTERKKRPVLVSGKFHSAPVTVDSQYVTIRFPRKVADYLELSKPEIHWTPVNGVIQFSAAHPHVVIPMISCNVSQFIPQEP